MLTLRGPDIPLTFAELQRMEDGQQSVRERLHSGGMSRPGWDRCPRVGQQRPRGCPIPMTLGRGCSLNSVTGMGEVTI